MGDGNRTCASACSPTGLRQCSPSWNPRAKRDVHFDFVSDTRGLDYVAEVRSQRRMKSVPATPAEAVMKQSEYEKELRKLQVRLCHLQDWVKEAGLRVVIIFEGRDGAGKGGTIRALTERVSPRVFRVVALPAPSDREKIPDVHAAVHAALSRGR